MQHLNSLTASARTAFIDGGVRIEPLPCKCLVRYSVLAHYINGRDPLSMTRDQMVVTNGSMWGWLIAPLTLQPVSFVGMLS